MGSPISTPSCPWHPRHIPHSFTARQLIILYTFAEATCFIVALYCLRGDGWNTWGHHQHFLCIPVQTTWYQWKIAFISIVVYASTESKRACISMRKVGMGFSQLHRLTNGLAGACIGWSNLGLNSPLAGYAGYPYRT